MFARDPSILLHGERLLIGAVRRLAVRSRCSGAHAQFEAACGCAGAEACRMLEVFLQQVARHGRRRLMLSAPSDPSVTADERAILDVFGWAQADAYGAMDAALVELLDGAPPVSLGAAACIVAQTLAINGCFVSATPRVAPSPRAPASCGSWGSAPSCAAGWTSA